MKKKIISALLAAVMVFSLTACGGGSDKSQQTERITTRIWTQIRQRWIRSKVMILTVWES